MTESLEMYLETISLLHERVRIARVTDIAQELGVSKSSVHTALHELERRGLIDHEHYGEIYLTDEGQKASDAIRERHALLTSFFRDLLGVSAKIAEDDACKIEHYLSAETMSRISDALERARTSGGDIAGNKGMEMPATAAVHAPASRRPRVNWVPVEPESKPGPRKSKP
jgi:DtxR family Mn-dependent transcriptional regulator